MEWIAPIASIIICIVLPYVVNVVKQADWPTNTKRWIAIVMSIIVGVAAGLIAGAPTPETLLTWVLGIVGGTQVAYAAFESVGVTSKWLDALEGIGKKTE